MRWRTFSKLVLVEQTLFGLPWVLIAILLPFFQEHALAQWDLRRWVCIFIAFCSARTAGMSFNRLIDREIDAANTRTQHRVLPAGEATIKQVTLLAWSSVAIFLVACASLNSICLAFSPLVLLLIWGYSYTKRFTSLCHLVMGFIQFFAPLLAWAAMTDTVDLAPVLLGGALLASIAANDIVYSLQDYEFDRSYGLHSIPVAAGPKASLLIARALHLVAILLLIALGISMAANAIYYIGVAVASAVYIYYHRSVDAANLSSVNCAFASSNLVVGLVLLLFTIGSLLWHVML